MFFIWLICYHMFILVLLYYTICHSIRHSIQTHKYIYIYTYVPAHMDAHIWQDSTSSTNVSCIQFASHGCSTHHIPDCKASLCLSSSLAASSSARSCSSHSPCRAPGIGWVWLLRRTEALTHSRHGPSTSQKDRTYHSSSQSNDTKYHPCDWRLLVVFKVGNGQTRQELLPQWMSRTQTAWQQSIFDP